MALKGGHILLKDGKTKIDLSPERCGEDLDVDLEPGRFQGQATSP